MMTERCRNHCRLGSVDGYLYDAFGVTIFCSDYLMGLLGMTGLIVQAWQIVVGNLF